MSFAYHGKRSHGPVKRAIAISSAVLAIWAGDSASGQVLLDPTLDTFGQQVSFSGSDVDTFARLENLPPNRSVGTIDERDGRNGENVIDKLTEQAKLPVDKSQPRETRQEARAPRRSPTRTGTGRRT